MIRVLACCCLLLPAACQSPGTGGTDPSGDAERRTAARSPAQPAGPVEAQAHPDREALRRHDLRVIGRLPGDGR